MINTTLIHIVNGLNRGLRLRYFLPGDKWDIMNIKQKVTLDLPNIMKIYWETLNDQEKEDSLIQHLKLIKSNEILLNELFELKRGENWKEIIKVNTLDEINIPYIDSPNLQLIYKGEKINLISLGDSIYTDDIQFIYGFKPIDLENIKVYRKPVDSKLKSYEFYGEDFAIAKIVDNEIIIYDKFNLIDKKENLKTDEIISTIVNGLRNRKKLIYHTLKEKDKILHIQSKVKLDLLTIIDIYWDTLTSSQKQKALEDHLNIINITENFLDKLFELKTPNNWYDVLLVAHYNNVNSSFMELFDPEFLYEYDGVKLEKLHDGMYIDQDENIYGFELISDKFVKIYRKSKDDNLDKYEFVVDEFHISPIIDKKIIVMPREY